jgi:transglutaminase-like putative cysteine protease
MRIRIKHQTTYAYGDAVRSAVQLLRMTPRSTETQFVRQWRVSIDADARLDRGEDAFGNITHFAFVEGPFTELKILVEGEIDTIDTGGVVRGSTERLPERLFLRETALTAPTPAIRDMARGAISSEGGDVIASLHRINETLHKSMAFDSGATTSTTTAAEAFEKKAGVCQDFAQIFISAARSVGVPARYANGYYLRTDYTDQEAGHAWAEAHIPELGWVAFDPSHGVCASERYVRVAIGSDSNDAAPIRGARQGGFSEHLNVSVNVSAGRAILESLPGQWQAQQQ